MDRAAADLTLAQKTYDRTRQLVATHDSPQSISTRTTAALTLAERTLDQARFAYNEAVAGFTREDLGIALAKVESCQGRCRDAEGLGRPDGRRCAGRQPGLPHPVEDGEFVLPGIPLITLVDLPTCGCSSTCARTCCAILRSASKLAVRVPALGDRTVELEVRVIGAKGEYTGWRATRATGDFDLRTFEVRAYPDPAGRRPAAGHERLYRLVGARGS